MKAILLLLFATALSASAELLDWTSTKGTTLKAELISASGDTVILKTAAGKQITLKRSQLDAASQAQLDNLMAGDSGNDDEEDEGATPGDPTKVKTEYKVNNFASGPWKGKHAVYECENFIAVADERAVVRIFQAKDGKRIPGTVDCYIRPALIHYPQGEPQRRKIKLIESGKEPSMQPKKISFEGESVEGVTFEVTYEFKDNTIEAYGHCKDPRKIDLPTRLHITSYYPGNKKITPETPESDRATIVGDSWFRGSTQDGPEFKYDFLTTVNMNEIEGLKSGLKEFEVKSPLYGPYTVKVTAPEVQHGRVRCWNNGTRAGYLGFSCGIARSNSSDRSDKAAITISVQ